MDAAFLAYDRAIHRILNPDQPEAEALGEENRRALTLNPAMMSLIEAHRLSLQESWHNRNRPNQDDWQSFVVSRLPHDPAPFVRGSLNGQQHFSSSWRLHGVGWNFTVLRGPTVEIGNTNGFHAAPRIPRPELFDQIQWALNVLEALNAIPSYVIGVTKS